MHEGGEARGGGARLGLTKDDICVPGRHCPPSGVIMQHSQIHPYAVNPIGRLGAYFQGDTRLDSIRIHRGTDRDLRGACFHVLAQYAVSEGDPIFTAI